MNPVSSSFGFGLAFIISALFVTGGFAFVWRTLGSLERSFYGAGRGSAKINETILKLEKSDLALECRLLAAMRKIDIDAGERFVSVREYSIAMADLRRRFERLEDKGE